MEDFIFGANILENLTTGMYQESKVIYREYIQNSCDQIDKAVELGILNSKSEGTINIWPDPEKRTITIEDNATGIPRNKFEQTLANIADSDKRIGDNKGFRGIGRLCGLAYCRELIFSSTAQGEDVVSTMRCDARKMREFLDRNVKGEKFTAGQVLNEIYSFSYEEKQNIRDEHWFKVELVDINAENTDLLDFNQVKSYLSFVAPVKYKNTFPFRTEIYNHAEKLGYSIDEYNIRLNGEEVLKKYSTRFKTSKGEDEIFQVQFKDFYDDNGNLVMWLWFGISCFKAVISKEIEMRGIRLRKENIQIGNDDALQKLFKEDRGQHYFVGELFAVSSELIPNSQRDYFNENNQRAWFEKEVKKYFRDVLAGVYKDGSTVNASYDKIDKLQEKKEEFLQKTNNNDYVDDEHVKKAEKELKNHQEKAEGAQKSIDRLREKTENSEKAEITKTIINHIESTRSKEKKPIASALIKSNTSDNFSITKSLTETTPKQVRRTDKLSRCNKQERKLISKIYSIIVKSTDEETAERIIQNIEEEFK